MNILFVSSEVAPYAKTGGLGDVCGTLPLKLSEFGHTVSIVMPKYSGIDPALPLTKVQEKITVPFDGQPYVIDLYAHALTPTVTTYFIGYDDYYARPGGIYGDHNGDYPDNLKRFGLFNRAVFELLKEKIIYSELVHCHDWPSALLPGYLKVSANEILNSTPCVLTLHNLAYQGIFPKRQFHALGFPDFAYHEKGFAFHDQVNFLKGGIIFSDVVTTVSEKYYREIQTPEGGFGLHNVLADKGERLYGILNGADYTSWNPANDPHIQHAYSLANIDEKKKNKLALLRLAGFDESQTAYPLIAFIGRLARQKGIDLLLNSFAKLSEIELFFILLGTGDSGYESTLQRYADRYRAQFSFNITFNTSLAHQILAGADMLIMPSLYEPCGLLQMYSLRYGTIPIVRATGGLDDTIESFDLATKKGNGFKFERFEPDDLTDKVLEAIAIYNKRENWKTLIENAIKSDFSWNRPARQYNQIYKTLCS